MRLKVDENLPVEVAELLQHAGYDATTVMAQGLSGEANGEVFSVCCQEGRALVTLDIGFADIRMYSPAQSPGVIVLRLRSQDKPFVLEVIIRLIKVLRREVLAEHLWIVDEKRVRIRA